MPHHSSNPPALTLDTLLPALTLLALAACGPGQSPTGPGADAAPPATAPAGTPAFAAAAHNSWSTRAPMPTPRSGLVAKVVENAAGEPILYAIGGTGARGRLATVEAYNFVTNTWTTRAPGPYRLLETNGVGRIGDKLYISGGLLDCSECELDHYTDHLFVYDTKTNTWSQKAPMPEATGRGVSGVIGGKLYVLTGSCEACEDFKLRRLYRYDPATNEWETLASSPHRHVGGAGAVIGDKFYVAGGQNNLANGGIGDLDVYDPRTGTWTAKAPVPAARVYAGQFLDDKFYVVGGLTDTAPLRTVQVYDPATGWWANRASMPTRRAALAAARVTYQGKSYLIALGGFSAGFLYSRESFESITGANEVYTP